MSAIKSTILEHRIALVSNPDEIDITVRNFVYEETSIDVLDQSQRIWLAENSFTHFCLLYLGHYFDKEPAAFHRELIEILEQEQQDAIGVIGFRGSAKSTFCSFAYPLWCAIFKKYNFIILINDTVQQVKLNIANIKAEIEENELIRSDFPHVSTIEKSRKWNLKWNETELLIGRDVFILGKSRGQKVRGLRFRQYRPQLIIIDDPEDYEWTRKKTNRDKTERWLNTEVLPAQEELKCKTIIIGNLLHKDALMGRLKRRATFKVYEFPLIDEKGRIAWPGKYPTMEAVEKQKNKISNSVVWQREYLLKIIAEEEQVISEADITYYSNDRLTAKGDLGIKPMDAGAALDLAISEKQTADLTALVSGLMAKEYLTVGVDGNQKGTKILYIKPAPVNKRIDMEQTIAEVNVAHKSMPLGNRIYVEAVAYQKAIIKEMRKLGLPIIEVRPIGDKRARLETVAMYIKQGLVRFPQTGCEALLEQLIGFGTEEHDDLVDALVYLILGMFSRRQGSAGMGKG